MLGYYQLGRKFALKTLLTILALAGALLVVSFPALTQDKLLIAVFGGFFWGRALGWPCGAAACSTAPKSWPCT